ncbi:MAG: hypothetical protein AB8G17_14650 [Gammaproteobacteria bacterium]
MTAYLRFFCALAALTLLSACAGTKQYIVDVEGSIPPPLVDPLPLDVAVHYSQAFGDYTTNQESLSGDTWRVAFKGLQQNYVHSMLSSAFDSVTIVDSAKPDPAGGYDLLIVPRVENFSFLTPAESGSKFFAVSMRHMFDILAPNGNDFGPWEINSYGRSRSSFGSNVRALASEACLDAMRDLATSIVVGIPEEVANREFIDLNDLRRPGAKR